MTGNEIRQRFLDFFAARGHRVVRSSSLVPANDPTLLFANAGMNQFKEVFQGEEKRDYLRAASSQKCVRAGGKHNDLENVGYTRRHHTFFEMLGNFSFGDYFKEEAIAFAWDLITREFGLDPTKLYITVFREDDEAEELWQSVAGVPKDRIFRLDEKDNFWQMGETGPCGPCSEIHYDLGPEAAEPGRAHEQFPLDGGGRFVEIWNLVFMQFNKDISGVMTPLPRPSIDTGMGLERLAAVLQGKLSNYETDLLLPIIERAAEMFGVAYGDDAKVDTALRINADHVRSTVFLIHDGIIPANEGRGYVLRKIMRRAMRNARLIGREQPYLHELAGFVAELMRPGYPELMESVPRVARVVRDEEHRYATTFLVAEKMFQDEAGRLASNRLPGDVSFRLYDTFGLALDEQEEMARERGLVIDLEGFEHEMRQQRERARASWKGAAKGAVSPIYQDLLTQHGRTRFLGYDDLQASGQVLAILQDEVKVEEAKAGGTYQIVLDQTPFYAETGGQVGDRGTLKKSAGEIAGVVQTAYPAIPGLTVHRVAVEAPIRVGDALTGLVDEAERLSTMRNHTGTHLLHAALRQVLGSHVKQAGSVVEPPRLRFDFTHFTAVDPAELAEIERIVNHEIRANAPVTTHVMPIEQAIATGAMALFGEKYGDQVRVVSLSDFSKELCGGTHVNRAGDIGVLKIVSESSISAGVRRIEAVTGEAALERFQKTSGALSRIAQAVRGSESDLMEQVERILAENRALERQNEMLKGKLADSAAGDLEQQAQTVNGVRVVVSRVEHMDRGQMRSLADTLRNKLKPAVVVLAAIENEAVTIIAAVTKDLTSQVHAGKLAGAVAQAVGGKGGGRPDLAEGGGKHAGALDAALQSSPRHHRPEPRAMIYDAVIVGAGPTGLACGIELKKLGLTALIIDKGCVVNSIYHYPTNLVFFTTPELLEIGGIPMTSLNEKPNRIEALKYYRRVADYFQLTIHQYERVDSIQGTDMAFEVHATDRHGAAQTYSARKVVLAIGYYDVANRLGVPGEKLPKVLHYYKEPHPYYNQDVVVVGAKNSAAIAALELFWTGARVSLVHRGDHISSKVKYWIKPNIENRIKSGEVKGYFQSQIIEILPQSVRLATPDGEKEIPNDTVFALIGYRPDLAFLEQTGIVLDPKTLRPKTHEQTLESARSGVYLAGVIVAGMHTNEIFIENGRFHGRQIAVDVAAKLDRA